MSEVANAVAPAPSVLQRAWQRVIARPQDPQDHSVDTGGRQVVQLGERPFLSAGGSVEEVGQSGRVTLTSPDVCINGIP